MMYLAMAVPAAFIIGTVCTYAAYAVIHGAIQLVAVYVLGVK